MFYLIYEILGQNPTYSHDTQKECGWFEIKRI